MSHDWQLMALLTICMCIYKVYMCYQLNRGHNNSLLLNTQYGAAIYFLIIIIHRSCELWFGGKRLWKLECQILSLFLSRDPVWIRGTDSYISYIWDSADPSWFLMMITHFSKQYCVSLGLTFHESSSLIQNFESQ